MQWFFCDTHLHLLGSVQSVGYGLSSIEKIWRASILMLFTSKARPLTSVHAAAAEKMPM